MEIKSSIKRIPGIYRTYRSWREFEHKFTLLSMGLSPWNRTNEDLFTNIYRRKLWRGKESASGPGSSVDSSIKLIQTLPILWREFNTHTVLDVPCGDFNWMRRVDLSKVDYLGGDIVADVVQANGRYQKPNIHFRKINLVADPLPKADMVICRDCFRHLSFADILAALRNIYASGSTYLLASTTTARANMDIPSGHNISAKARQLSGRELNLELEPFMLPAALKAVDEPLGKLKEGEIPTMSLWKIADLSSCPWLS